MSTKSRWVRIALLLLSVGGALVGCGSPLPPASPTPFGPEPTPTVPFHLPVTIALAGSFPDQDLAVLDQKIATFEAANADIRVEVVEAPQLTQQRRPWIDAKLSTADTSIDLYLLDPAWVQEFAAEGWLAGLDDGLRGLNIDLGAFPSSALEANTYRGHLMALPWGEQSVAMSAHSLYPDQVLRFLAYLLG